MKSKVKILIDRLDRFSVEVTDLSGATSRDKLPKKVKYIRLDMAQAALKELDQFKNQNNGK